MISFVDLLERARDRYAHRRDRADEGAAMLLTVFFIVFTTGLAMVMLGILLAQLPPAQFVQRSTRTVYAAQTGIQSALSVMRSNTKVVGVGASAATYGDPSKLPKTLTGNVDGAAGGGLTYSVTIQYFTSDPTGKDSTWLAANAIANTGTTQPTYARIVSQGSDSTIGSASATRTVAAIYAFTTTDINIPGGLIFSSDQTKCLMADSATVGSLMKLVAATACTDDARDLWVYDTDWKIKLASTIGSATVLCITGQTWTSSGGTTSAAVNATLQPCATSNATAPGNQLWSWDSALSYVAQNSANTARSGRWLSISGTTLIEQSGSSAQFNPSPAVGAGGANYGTHQIVNYSEFGRCMDVTNENLSMSYMIVYPCKQDPTGTTNAILWNHKWYYNEPVSPAVSTGAQAIYVRYNNNTANTYCLTANTAASGNTDMYFVSCTNPTNVNNVTALQKFIRNQDTKNPLTAYTIQLNSDPTKCLTAVAEPGYAWSHIRVLACNGSTAQKWNAPPTTVGSKLGDFVEVG